MRDSAVHDMEQIYLTYRDRVCGYVKSRAGSIQDAEDLLSCVFLKIHESIGGFDAEKASLSTWIYAITRNTVNDYLRRRYQAGYPAVCEDALADLACDDLSAVDRLIMEEQLDALAAALEQLPEREREIILLRFCHGQTGAQVARLMKLSPQNVRQLQHVAIGRLKKIMKREEIQV